MERVKSLFENLNKIPLYLLFVLLPIFFLPFKENQADLSKQILASFCLSISLIGFFGKKIFSQDFSLKLTKIFLFFFVSFILISFISFFNFPYFYTAFFGNSSWLGDSILSFILYFLAIFLFSQSFDREEEILFLIFLFCLSSGILGLISLLSFQKIFIFPFRFAKTLFFNPLGDILQFSLFLGIFLPLIFYFLFKTKHLIKIIFIFIVAIFLFNTLFLGSKLTFFLLAVQSLFLFVLTFKPNFHSPSWFLSLLFLFSFSILFYFLPISQKNIISSEVLPYPFQLSLLKNAFSFNLRNKILGTGPASFLFTFSRFRPTEIHRTILWTFRFSRGNSFFIDWLLTRGILGGAFLILFFFLLFQFILPPLFLKEGEGNFFLEKTVILTLVFIFSLTFFIFHPNFTNQLIFWSFLGIALFFLIPQRTQLKSTLLSLFIFNFFFILSFVFSIFLFYFQGTKLISYSIQSLVQNAKDPFFAERLLNFATKIHPFDDNLWRDLAEKRLLKLTKTLTDQNLIQKNSPREQIVNLVFAIEKATRISPFNVANWNLRGFIFRQLLEIDETAQKLSLESYQKAIELEPNFPYSWTEKARVYIFLAQKYQNQGEEEKAKEYLNSAVSLLEESLKIQRNYPHTFYLLAVAKDQLGERKEAISALEEGAKLAPHDWVLFSNLGILYWREQDWEKTREYLERAELLNPQNQKIKLFLMAAYDALKEKEKAIQKGEELLKLDPANQTYQKVLKNLKENSPPFEGIEEKELFLQVVP